MIVDRNLNKKVIGVFLIDGDINGGQLATTTKPSSIKRFLIKIILGWKWVKIEDINGN